MIDKYGVRTDLALEEQERFKAEKSDIPGVEVEKICDEQREITTTVVRIKTENGARAMKKPTGVYVTLEAPGLGMQDEDCHREISRRVAKSLRDMMEGTELRGDRERQVLLVGLGNRNITPDSLGPRVVDHVQITRHIIREFGKYAFAEEKREGDRYAVSAIVPGVMAQTGMESSEIVKAIIQETGPECVLVIDALAARNSKRLNRTIQLTDTGIRPGSGVENHRVGLTRESLGIPVLAVGVPTVVDAATIVSDTMENLIAAMETSDLLKGAGVVLQGYSQEEKYELIRELMSPHLNGMFVTPKDIDDTVNQISYTISEALNILFA